MRTFWISTLGCKVNHYESEQLATLLRARGLTQVAHADEADLCIVNTCSITTQAASKSRQSVRRAVHLPPVCGSQAPANRRVIVTGCWATSDPDQAAAIPGVRAVLGHHQNIADELQRLLTLWESDDQHASVSATTGLQHCRHLPKSLGNDGWMTRAGSSAPRLAANSKALPFHPVKENLNEKAANLTGTISLPQLTDRQDAHQRAFLKVQDGCDAWCTYCIIPKLRPNVWSKPVQQVIEEARAMVAAGHPEIVLTGIFLGAYGQATALRRRQANKVQSGIQDLVEALCTRVPGLRRLRLSSLEPGDLSEELLAVLRSHRQVVPHFHLPLQSGSDAMLRRMNRQYSRDDFLRMVDRVRRTFDRPALTTDVIVGFPGENDEEFDRTLEVVAAAGFIHVHAFPFSPRPGTAAARWKRDLVPGSVVNERIAELNRRAAEQSLAFRRQFVGQTAEIMVEKLPDPARSRPGPAVIQNGRCERYFTIHFEHEQVLTGRCVPVHIDRVTPTRTFGTLIS